MRSFQSSFSIAALLCAAQALAACRADSACPSADLTPLGTRPSYAVVLSDFSSSAIALLDTDGALVTEAWIDSGTRASAISAGLGGDVVIPRAFSADRLAIMERYNADRLTLIAFETGEPIQLDLRGDNPDSPTGHSPNPQDMLRIDSRLALVSRLNPSFHPRTPEFARGNDVIALDIEAGHITKRIDLAADLDVAVGEGEEPTHIYARPTTLLLLERGAMRRVLVGLQRLDATFRVSGPAAIAVIDPDTLTRVGLVDLPEYAGCHALTDVPDAPEHAIALCTGASFVSESERRTQAALIRLVMSETGGLEIERVWRAVDHPHVPSPTSSPLALDRDHVLFVADPRGDEDGIDQWMMVNLETGNAELIFAADDAFVLGTGAFDPERGLLLLPDAHARAVHRMSVDGAVISLRDSVRLPICRGLPPRQIMRL